MASYIDASQIAANLLETITKAEAASNALLDAPPTPTSDSSEPTKKKRKAWGQPVPPINPILPPRKRAKTAEEKEQRKNERILRNRRAADKSRQRQKQEVEALKYRQIETEAENAKLKSILAQYQAQFGSLPGCEFNPQLTPASLAPSQPLLSQPTPFSLDESNIHNSDAFSQGTSTPMLSATSPTSLYHGSPALAPTLDLGETAAATYPGAVDVTGMTQYPAEILCDPQCQPATLMRLRTLPPSRQLFEVLTWVHFLITSQASSATTMLSEMWTLLVSILSQQQPHHPYSSSTTPATTSHLSSLILTNFHLIHILISMPSTETQSKVFRLKLLSRLLACNPNLALLLENAADRDLQQLVSQDDWADFAASRWTFSSLMTIKWAIKRLEDEHARYRAYLLSSLREKKAPNIGAVDGVTTIMNSQDASQQAPQQEKEQIQEKGKWKPLDGVDYEAVEHSASLWWDRDDGHVDVDVDVQTEDHHFENNGQNLCTSTDSTVAATVAAATTTTNTTTTEECRRMNSMVVH